MTEKTEALRLAEVSPYLEGGERGQWIIDAAAELRRLHTDAEESEALRERLSALLRNTAIALRGPEPELTRWSWHDLPDLAAALKTELRRLSAENEALWKEREEPHKTIEMYVRECNRLESERDEARRTVREAHEAGTRLTAQRDALLEALRKIGRYTGEGPMHSTPWQDIVADLGQIARAAIKAVEGENHAKNL